MPRTLRAVPRNLVKPLVVVASLGACAAAQAEEQPWYIGASLAYTHESNIFRLNDPKLSDNIWSTGVLGGFHWRPGRQHLYLDANAAQNRYGDLKQLNNTSGSVTTGLEWQTVEHLSGSFRYVERRNLSDYSVVGTPADRNLEKVQSASAGVRYGFTSVMGVEGGVERRKLDYSLTTERNTTQDVASLGLRYTGGGQLSFGATGRVTKGDTPLYRPFLPLELTGFVPTLSPIVEPDKNDRKDLDFTVTWIPSGVSTVIGRVSLTHEDHTAPSRADFSGVTGAVTWEYKPTGKTTIRSSLMRDTGNEASFLSLAPLGLQGLSFDNNRIDWIGLVEANWEATSKILVNGTLRYVRGTLDTITGSNYSNSATRFGLGARYVPTRAITLGCNFLHDSGSATASATVYGCSAQFVFR